MVNNKQQSGVALIQVLLLTTLLLMMALHFTLSSAQQVDIASSLDDKLQAELKLRTVENELLFALLTLPKSEGFAEITKAHPIGKIWNFHGGTFYPIDDVSVQLQDLNGLVSLYGMRQREYLVPIFSGLGFTELQIRQIFDSLQKWQSERPQFGRPDALRHNFLPHLSELKFLHPMTVGQYAKAEKLLTTFPTFQFNPRNAPDELLLLLYPAIAQPLIKLRKSSTLSANRFIQLARISDDDETLTFTTSDTFHVTLEARHGQAVAKKSFICYIRDQSRTPLTWIQ